MASTNNKTKKTTASKVAATERAKSIRDNSKVGKQLNGFMDFVRTQGVVGLAVGLAIGTQASSTVKSIVEGVINPFVGFVVGNQEGLASASWNVIGKNSDSASYWVHMGDRTLVIGWGAVLSSLITLLAVAAVIFYVVKGLKLDKLDKQKEA